MQSNITFWISLARFCLGNNIRNLHHEGQDVDNRIAYTHHHLHLFLEIHFIKTLIIVVRSIT